MDLKKIFEFLIDLKFNNNRTWFKENNDRYQNAKLEFEQFIELLLPRLKQIDKSIDVLSAKGGRKSPYAGYYIHFEPDNSFIGGGIYMPQPPALKSLRTEIFENTEEYKRIINNSKFKKIFPEIYGEPLKTAPKGFPKDFADIDLLKNKHFAVTHKVNNSFWYENGVIDNIVDIYKVQYNFNLFFNRVIEAK